MQKRHRFVDFLLLSMIFLLIVLPVVLSIQGTSPSYSMDAKLEAGPGGRNASSTNYAQRFIGGIRAVSEYITSSYTGRLGILGAGSVSISGCGNLDTANTVYTLTQDVEASDTCFTITANHVTLNCDGYQINYSQSSTGYAVRTTGYNNSVVANCSIVQGSTSRKNSYAIYFRQGTVSEIKNNTIETSGSTTSNARNHGIYLYKYANATIAGNNITTTGRQDYAIYLRDQSNSTNISSNQLRTNARYGYGVYSYRASLNTVYNNNITTTGNNAYDVRIHQGRNNNITSNNLSTEGTSSYAVYIRGGTTPSTKADSNKIDLNEISILGRNAYGVYLYRDISDNKIEKNKIITRGTRNYGILLYRNTNTTLIDSNNITLSGTNSYGIRLHYYSQNNNLTANNITSSITGSRGIYLEGYSDSNLLVNNTAETTNYPLTLNRGDANTIYNNIFNSSSRRIVSITKSASYVNELNTSKTSATNIVGGSNLGGNYWINRLKTGFSQTCSDNDADGICDGIYTINIYNKDYLPLTKTDNVNASVEIWSPENESFVNGRVILKANASDDNAVANVVFQYSNSSTDWTNIPDCNLTSMYRNRYYRCKWYTADFSNDTEGYDIRAVAYDVQGNTGTHTLHYTIDRTRPVVYEMEIIYPDNQSSVRNGQNITLEAVVSDAPYIAAGIDYTQANPINLNGTNSWTLMSFVSGSKAPDQNSTWHLNVTINATTGIKRVNLRVYDAAIPAHNRKGDRWSVQVDNDAPTYDSMNSTKTPYNNTVATFVANVQDNFDLNYFIFSQNWSGSWENDSAVDITGTNDYIEYEKIVYTGNFSYKFYIFDDAGNMNETSTENIEVYGNKPELTIYLVEPEDEEKINSIIVNFTFYYLNGYAENCSLYLNTKLNGTINDPANETYLNFSRNLEDGDYDWYISCMQNETEGDDNITVEYISDLYSLSIDTTPPLITLVNPKNITYNQSSLSFNVTLSEDASWCGYSLDNAANVTMISLNTTHFNYPKTGLTAGSHNISVSCNDTSNNYNSTEILYFVIDFPDISINITSPEHLEIIPRGNDAAANEDDLGEVSNTMEIIAKVYNSSNDGISGATCFFYFGDTYINQSYTNSSGHCNITYDKSSESVGEYALYVNYTYLVEDISRVINKSNINISLVRYVTPRFAGGKGVATQYVDNQTAILYFNTTKINSSGTFFYDPNNITVNATTSAGNQYPESAYVAGYRIYRTATGQYESHVIVNMSLGPYIRWEIRISEDNLTTFIGTSLHGDVEIVAGPICGNSLVETGEECDDGNVVAGDGCSSTCTAEAAVEEAGGGGGGGGGEEECTEQWVCTDWSECINGTQTRECNDLNRCGTDAEKPVEEQECAPCTPDWRCKWSLCDESGYRDYTCKDINKCGTLEGKPKERTEKCECIPDWRCEEWSECNVDYDIYDIIKGEPIIDGKQIRGCVDITGCEPSTIEKRECDMGVPVWINKTEWCHEEYIEIYEIKTNKLVSRIRESSVGLNLKLDIGFIVTEFIGYCDYCYDGIKDYDEEKIDCGGPNCPPCITRRKVYDYIQWLQWSLWLIVLLFLIYLMYIAVKRRKEVVKAPRVRRAKVSIYRRLSRKADELETKIEQIMAHRRVKKVAKRAARREKRKAKRIKRREKRAARREIRRIKRRVRRKEIKAPEITALEKKLKEWKKKGYYDTAKLEAKLKALREGE